MHNASAPCIYALVHTHKHTHTHTRIHAHTHTHTYIHMHARICIQYAHAYYLQYSAQPWTPPPPSPRGGTQAPLDQQTPLHVYGISLLSGHMSRASYPYNHPSSNGGTQPPLQLHIPQADARPLSSSTWSPPTPSAASDRGERASERARGRERGSEGARGREGLRNGEVCVRVCARACTYKHRLYAQGSLHTMSRPRSQ